LPADELCNYASLTQKVPLEEVRYFLLLSKDLGYMNKNIFESLESDSETLSKMLNGLIKSLTSRL
jgi:four helix bundle protein